MNKIIIASHGKFASGIEDAVKILVGERKDIDFISAYTTEIADGKLLKEKIINIADENSNKNIFILTDIIGGSITNTAVELMGVYNNIHVITGMNLGLVLEFINEIDDCNEKSDYKEIINQTITSARDGILYINRMVIGDDDDDQIL